MKPKKQSGWTKQSGRKGQSPKPLTSTYSNVVQLLGFRAAYYDISTQPNNLFELPDLRRFPSNHYDGSSSLGHVLEESQP